MGTVTNLKGFYNPASDKSLSNNKLRPKKRRGKKTARWASVRLKVLKYFGLHDTATIVGICFCIHKETGWPIPGEDNKCRGYVTRFYRKIRNKPVTRKVASDDDFHDSKKWKELRFVALRLSEGTCELCGARASDGVSLHVDHIKPRSKFPSLQYDLGNLQVLCADCNFGKSNYDDTDFRDW